MRAQVKRQECHEAQRINSTVSSDILFVLGWHLRTQVEIGQDSPVDTCKSKTSTFLYVKHKDYKYNSHVVLFVIAWVVAPDGVGPTHYVAHPPVIDTRNLAKLSPLRAPQQRRTNKKTRERREESRLECHPGYPENNKCAKQPIAVKVRGPVAMPRLTQD